MCLFWAISEVLTARIFNSVTISVLRTLCNPGDLVTSLRETGEKILLPYPIRQPARSREFAFAVIAKANVDIFQNYFCLALYHDWNSELCFT